jgi:hypothetical protein
MAAAERKNWKDLCQRVVDSDDPEEVLNLVQELNQLLEIEELDNRSCGKARRPIQAPKSDAWESCNANR